MAVVGGCGGAVATSIAVGEAVDVDALQLLADVGKLGVGTVRRGLGPAVKMIISPLRKTSSMSGCSIYSIRPILRPIIIYRIQDDL